MNYVVTAHPADAVSHALVGNFISESELDLIVSNGSRLVIYSVGPEGLQPFKEVPMYGRIATMQLWCPPGQNLAQLFLSTDSNKFCILAWDGSDIVTKVAPHVPLASTLQSCFAPRPRAQRPLAPPTHSTS